MGSRRGILGAIGGFVLAGGSYVTGAYRESERQVGTRLQGQSSLISSSAGPLEYSVAGVGAPILMIHGTGGGFDQGQLFASTLRTLGFQIVAPSRFGYLRSAFPENASPARQADVLVELLDQLGIERIPVVGGSAGALTAAEFAARHPDRCSHLILLVPAANLTNDDPVAFTPLQRWIVNVVLGSDFWFWSLASFAPEQMIRTLLATDPALLETVSELERRRANLILAQLLPINRKVEGLRSDAFWAGAPSHTEFEQINVPTLILSCEDDLFGTAKTARILAERMPDTRLILYPEGGHIWLGHDDDVAYEISRFVRPST